MELSLESIDTATLLELSFMLESSIDVQFQAWMALSFAVIVASYSAKDQLATRVRFVIAATYLIAVYALFARWMTEWTRLDEIHAITAMRELPFQPVWFGPESRILAYVVGSLVTILAIFYFGSKTDKNGDIDT
jgi:hypothetical protein